MTRDAWESCLPPERERTTLEPDRGDCEPRANGTLPASRGTEAEHLCTGAIASRCPIPSADFVSSARAGEAPFETYETRSLRCERSTPLVRLHRKAARRHRAPMLPLQARRPCGR